MAAGTKAVKFTAQFIALMFGISLTIFGCLSSKSFIYDAFGPVHSVIGAQRIFLLFIIVHWLRIWLGLQFIDEDADSTFGAALTKQIADAVTESQRIRKWHQWILLVLFITLAVHATALAGNLMGLLGLNLFLVIQGVCLLLFDWLFWRELTQKGPEFSSNRFIVIGDGATLFMIAAVVVSSTLAWVGRPLDQHYVTGYFLFFTGGLLVVFCGEIWCQYGPATLSLMRSLSTKSAKPGGDSGSA